MSNIQYLLFEETTEERLERQVAILTEKLDRQRKSLHAKNGELLRRIDAVQHQLDCVMRAMARNEKIEFKEII